MCNVCVAFEALSPEAKALRKEWDNKTGFNWWFQDRLGLVVRARAREEWDADDEWDTPPFMPSRKKRELASARRRRALVRTMANSCIARRSSRRKGG